MASCSKVERSAVRPDRPSYPSGSCGSYIAGSVDKSAMENPILSSLPSMSRTGSTVTQGDVTDFLQCLRFDPKSMATEYKFNRHSDFKQLASAALGVQDGSLNGKPPSFLPEGVKRLRAGLRESTIKARERVKIFSEILPVANKCFPSIPSRKRLRPNGLSGNRSVMGGGVGKMGTPNHASANVSDFEQQKVEERGKHIVPNKRTRTSMVDQRVDVHPVTPARSADTVERDKEVLRMTNSNGLQGEDRSFPIVRDGWEKPKMKKKRSVIKADATSSPSSGSIKPIDGYREPKEGIDLRHIPDARSRVTDSYVSRPGPANGGIGAGKSDGKLLSISKTDRENTPLYDKRDRSYTTEKGRKKIKAVNKEGAREDFIPGSTTSTKLHANTRGLRSGTGSGAVLPKLSPVVQQATASNDWGLLHGTSNKTTNHKGTLSIRSSSPLVAQWADRRTQKISRTARRTNLVPVVPTNDEIPLDSHWQSKSKVDHMLLSALSDSEESGAFKVTGKGKKYDKFEDKSGKNVYKMSNLAPLTRKSKLEKGEGHADGVSRGQTGRVVGSARFTTPMKGEKLGRTGTAKQLRTAKLSFDKSESTHSKLGQLSVRKLSDRNAYTRHKHTAASTTSDFLGHALSSPFWRQVEPFFGLLSDMDISYLKRQDTVTTPKTVASGIDSSSMLSNGMDARNVELDSDPLAPRTPSPVDIPLCQRLLAALMSEDESAEPNSCGNDGLKFYIYDTKFEVETDIESKIFSERSFHNMELSEHDAFSGYGIKSTWRSCHELKHNLSDNQIISMNERLLLEIQSIGLYPQLLPDLVHTGEEDISKDIGNLERKHQEKVFRMENQLGKLLRSTTEIRQLQEKEFEQHSLDKVTKLAYQKYMSCWGPNASGGKSAKFAKQEALALVNRTLDQCQKFETTGNICFDEPLFREMFASGSWPFIDSQLSAETKIDAGQLYGNSMERAPDTQQSLHNIYIGAKGKIRKRDKECKGSNGFKVGQPALNNTKGERQTKTKLQRNAAQLSNSNNGPQFKISDHHKPTDEIKLNNVKENDEYDEPLDFSHLQIPEMDAFGDDHGEHGQDIGSWLNIDDEGFQGFQDDDYMGLEIPMDDLTNLNMMV